MEEGGPGRGVGAPVGGMSLSLRLAWALFLYPILLYLPRGCARGAGVILGEAR
ncbi:MAG: hypothetical protein NVSMB65_20470 [Chloroflexota bacterium]